MQASPRYWDSRHKIPHTLCMCIYTYFTLIPADSDKEKQAPKHNFHPSPTSSTISLYSRDLQWEEKKKETFLNAPNQPLCPQTLLSASCSLLPPRGSHYYSMKRKGFAQEWKWSQKNVYWGLWFYILMSKKASPKHLARDSIPHLRTINVYFPQYQGLVHFLGSTYPLNWTQ